MTKKKIEMLEINAYSLPKIAQLEGCHYVTAFKRMQKGKYVKVRVHSNRLNAVTTKYIPTEDIIAILNTFKIK